MLNKLCFLLFTLLFSTQLLAKVVVVSDLDDTVRKAHALNKADAIRRVIMGVKPFMGLQALYTDIATFTPEASDFHYVSASKEWYYDGLSWLNEFAFPKGKVYQRSFQAEISSIDFKREKLRELCQSYRKEKGVTFFLFGDSGQNDTKVYREFVKDVCPEVTSHIFIRDVRGEAIHTGHILSDNETHFINEHFLLSTDSLKRFVTAKTKDYLTRSKKEVPSYIYRDYVKYYVQEVCSDNNPLACERKASSLWTDYFNRL